MYYISNAGSVPACSNGAVIDKNNNHNIREKVLRTILITIVSFLVKMRIIIHQLLTVIQRIILLIVVFRLRLLRFRMINQTTDRTFKLQRDDVTTLQYYAIQLIIVNRIIIIFHLIHYNITTMTTRYRSLCKNMIW